MNIFFRELRANFKSLLIWAGIVIVFAFMGVAEFSAYYDNPDILGVIDNLPAAMIEAFNINSFNITTITGFFGVMFTYFALILSIFGSMLGTEIVTKEERDKTAEFFLAFPVSRGSVLIAKLLASFVNCGILALITWGINIAFAQQFSPDSKYYEFLALCIGAFFILEILFLSLGFLLGCALKQHKRASSIGISLILLTYFLSILASLSEQFDNLKYFSPFTYFDPVKIFNESKIEVEYVWLSLVIVVIAFVLSYFTYSRRDINI